ncbi:tail fiber domain-containing protein [Mariniphaga sp.]|uniref:tail fiber domain-containing protein n=1 Tax=Mariniphaga sp. TaxID=1954475 RepID=UPI003565CEA3
MKKSIFTLFFSLFAVALMAQVPAGFSYQAVVRNNSGEVIASQTVKFKFSILQNSATGTPVYVETQSIVTNDFGLANLVVGSGTKVSGNFNPASWGNKSHFLKVELDPANGNTFSHLGTMQLMAVPYAFHAKTVEIEADGDPTNEIQALSISGTNLSLSKGGGIVTLPSSGGGDNWGTQTVVSDATLNGEGTTSDPLKVIGDLTDNQTLSISGSELSISRGNSVTLPAGSDNLWTLSGSNIFRTTGLVGIGTNSPSAKLHVSGNVLTDGSYKMDWGDYGCEMRAEEQNLELINLIGGGIKFYTYPTAGPSASMRMFISKEGAIGIGTMMPQYKVHIADGNLKLDDGSIYLEYKPELFKPDNGYRIIGEGNTDVIYGAAGSNMILNNKGGGSILFATSQTAGGTGYYRLAISETGKIGINTISPAAGLHLKGTGFPGSFMYLESNSGQDAGFRLYEGTTEKWHIFNNAAGGGLTINNNAYAVAIFAKQSNAFVGLGTTSPTQKLHVVGNAYKTEGGTAWATSSDLRLKTILGNYEKGLDEINGLNAVRFVYNEGNPRELLSDVEQVGFVAQDVQKIFPEAVSEAEDGYLDFNIHAINVALVNAIKELKAENDRLKAENREQNLRIERLERIFSASAQNEE